MTYYNQKSKPTIQIKMLIYLTTMETVKVDDLTEPPRKKIKQNDNIVSQNLPRMEINSSTKWHIVVELFFF